MSCPKGLFTVPLFLILYSLFLPNSALADWPVDFTSPGCTFSLSPSSPVTKGATVVITAQAGNASSKVTKLYINDQEQSITPAQTVSITWNTGDSKWPIGNYTISGEAINSVGNAGPCTPVSFTIKEPAPSPVPKTTNNSMIKVNPGYCYMNWWQSYCSETPTLYYFIDSQVGDFYIQVEDPNWGTRKICDTTWTWDPSATCNRTSQNLWNLIDIYYPIRTQWGWSLLMDWFGSKRQVSPFTISSKSSATKYSIIGKQPYNSTYRELASTNGYGFRYPMPAPYINYLDGKNCQNGNVTGSAAIRISFPTPPWPYSYDVRPIMYAYISDDPNFSNYYYKEVNRSDRTPYDTYTDAPLGFADWTGKALTLEPNKFYYVRLYGYWYDWSTRWYNGYNEDWYSSTGWFYRLLCPTNGGWCGFSDICSNTCGAGKEYQTNCNCPAPANGGAACSSPQSRDCTNYTGCTFTWIEGGFGACDKSCGGGRRYQTVQCQRSDDTIVPDSNCNPATKPATSQDCNSQACLSPWIQTEGGDVHSNIRIRAPGGP